ncbi:MAG: Cation efflux system protein CusB [Candidatus Gallionella acididurans]|uniref:Cation efflux system protein CusB n=1 Tax=Candidatus Gallionella acididurans TaxID=1796491 RepID=A0A139BUQ9_9PROT|nr:MAG: Cation efflux system protein CusB [Candidatus Gallionella acididurans]
MKTKQFAFPFVALIIIGAVAYASYRVGLHQGTVPAPAAVPPAADTKSAHAADPATGKTVLYWHDPMVPGQRFDKPGKSPFMDMPLVPVYADEGSDGGKVVIDPRVQQNLGIRTVAVTRGNLTSRIEVIGNVAYNERELAVVQARANGYIEKLYVRATLDRVHKGQPLASLYVPDWVAAQEDFLTAQRLAMQEGSAAGRDLVDAARQRMRLVGMSEEQRRLVETSGKIQERLVIAAPVSGVVAELDAREGMTVVNGAPLFRINGLDTVWINAEVPEDMAAQVHPGNSVEISTASLSGKVFKGKVSTVLPDVNPVTRTLKARIELANPGQRLVPGMYATVNFSPEVRRDVLLVPSAAVIQTGKRSVVIVMQADGKFVPVDIEAGGESHGQTEILKGLAEGQKVVASGQFLIDSEASLRATSLRMGNDPKPAGNATPTHHGRGKVETIGKDTITISHGPITSLQWGAMTMGFKLPAGGIPPGIKAGDRVDFEIRPDSDGGYEIVSIKPAAGDQP